MVDVLIFSDINNIYGFSRYAGPYRIASELRKNNISVQVIEFFADLTTEEIQEIINKYVSKKTLWVGFSTTLWTAQLSQRDLAAHLSQPQSLRSAMAAVHTRLFPRSDEFMNDVFRRIRLKNENCKIVVGGYKASSLSFKGVDYWILGQGEGSTLALTQYLKNGGSLFVVKSENGDVLSDRMHPCKNFSSSQILWQKEDYLFPNEHVPIEIARGCVFKCSFCGFDLNGKKRGEYVKGTETLEFEMLRNFEEFGITNYMLTDDTLNDTPEKIEALHQLFMKLPFKTEFSAYARIDLLMKHPFMIDALQEMGLRSVEFGIESLNQQTRLKIGKGTDPLQVKQALHHLKNKWSDQVYMAAGFIVGLPEETEQSLAETISWLESSDCPLDGIQLNRLWIGSPINILDHGDLSPAGYWRSEKGWNYGNLSRIAVNPGSHGYKTDANDGWQNSAIDLKRANEIERKFYESSRAMQKYSLSIFQYYNRMRNINFTHSEIGSLYFNDSKAGAEAESRRQRLRNIYMNQVLG